MNVDFSRKMIAIANDFLEVAKRCSFPKENITKDNLPLLVPEFVNRAFACELYLKAIAALRNIDTGRKHELDDLFYLLNDEDKRNIYDTWRECAGENIIDVDYIKKMFIDNLKSIRNVFKRFRYAHEWSGGTISISSSYTPDQYHLLFNFQVYSRFLEQFVEALQMYVNIIKLD